VAVIGPAPPDVQVIAVVPGVREAAVVAKKHRAVRHRKKKQAAK